MLPCYLLPRQLFKICISIKPRTIIGEELLALLKCNLSGLYTLRNPYLQLAHELLGVVLHIVEHLGHRLAINHLVDVMSPKRLCMSPSIS